jgi:glycerol uptake facilitator-like aquaporin
MWIGGAYLFTSSTSFANPAITLGRSLTDSFSGIAIASVPLFVAAQFIGALIGHLIANVLVKPVKE